MTPTSGPPPYPDAARARLLLSYEACALSDLARAAVPFPPDDLAADGTATAPGAALTDALRILTAAHRLVAAAVVYERAAGTGWPAVADALAVSPDAARAHFVPAETAFLTDLRSPAPEPPSLRAHMTREPLETAQDLDDWLRNPAPDAPETLGTTPVSGGLLAHHRTPGTSDRHTP
ncbi:hypothetical protein AB0D49_18070 [Streptomyces sp. NPDC048290]|uniref:hypothetical protein n=1 Tax=Streptomyces sp. NPDC048290 TaxID=3155811 RepID=UPI003433FA4A